MFPDCYFKVFWFLCLTSEGIRSFKVVCEYFVLFLIERYAG